MKKSTLIGKELHPLFHTWQGMINRCHNPKDRSFYKYGAKGIRVCKQWVESFSTFLLDMGEKPGKEYSLDRIDVTKGYSPKNCRWATLRQQARNRTNTLKVFFDGKERILIELCEELGKNYEIVRGRLKIGMTLEEAFSRDDRYRHKQINFNGKIMNLKEYCIAINAKYDRVRDRLSAGWTLKDAILVPKNGHCIRDKKDM